MPKIEIYTTPICPFCNRAKKLLKAKNADFEEIDVFTHPRRKKEMKERAQGRHTVPQIFIDGEGIGGCDELYQLDAEGKLDPLLQSSAG